MKSVKSLLCSFLLFVCIPAAVMAEDRELGDIYNFHRVSDSLLTAGQVVEADVPNLKEAGVDVVINLAVADEERNGDEDLWLAKEGISYTHIPVVWAEPNTDDLDYFFAVMNAAKGKEVLVHCFANYRASAFVYLYQVLEGNVAPEEAEKDMRAIWDDAAFEEYAHWRKFIDETLAARLPR